ncbi:hypothetical protein OUZ56_005555 [Daphnia magna]|uniref:Regulatory protein zeste n=1 Tax=Daphnia magna TaxID=35525 RepID=A0ABQ9YT37_9CRUS|nr:hypothetical protein OUZ56_005555 [Daphnia magna]
MDAISGAFSAVITKESRKTAWIEITAFIAMKHPDCPVKTERSVRKKWNNFETREKAVIRHHLSGLNETGCGPSNRPLCNLFQKYWEWYLGIYNPFVAAEIDMGIDTEKDVVFMNEVEMADHILGRPTSSTPAAINEVG